MEKMARGVPADPADLNDGYDDDMEIADIARLLVSRWKLLVLGPLGAGVLALCITFLIPPTYTASRTFMPPQQAQGAAASARAALGSLAGLAGGMTPAAYLLAASFQRESVGVSLQENLAKTRRDTETELVRESTTQRVSTSEEAAEALARTTANSRLIERLRSLQPAARLVFQRAPEVAERPDMRLEDGDRLSVPPKPSTVGVFGSVFNTGRYLYRSTRTVGDSLRLAGRTKGAGEAGVFVVRVNGQVVSSLQRARWSWFNRGNQIASVRADPGATVFVSEEFNKLRLIQAAKDWKRIMYQFGIGIAGITALTR